MPTPDSAPLTPSARKMLNVARLAHEAAKRVLVPYSHRFWPKKFTQPQLAACVILKIYFRQDYRGICGLLDLMPAVRELLGLRTTPNYSTLARFAQRVLSQDVPYPIFRPLVGFFKVEPVVACPVFLAVRNRLALMPSRNATPPRGAGPKGRGRSAATASRLLMLQLAPSVNTSAGVRLSSAECLRSSL